MNRFLKRAVVGAGAALMIFPLGLGAQPQTLAGTPFEGVRKGDRVRLTLKSKQPFSGVVRSVSRDLLTLDLRWEKDGVEGTMGFTPELIRKVDVLGALDDRELLQRRTDRERRLKEAEDDLKRVAKEREAARLADEAARAEGAGETAAPKPAAGPSTELSPKDMEKAMALLKEYPPTAGWGTAPDKTLDWLRIKFATIGAVPTPTEQRFMDNYDLWLKAREMVEKAPAAKGSGPAAVPARSPKGNPLPPAPPNGLAPESPSLPATPEGLPPENPPASRS
jgi:hypothetical protein